MSETPRHELLAIAKTRAMEYFTKGDKKNAALSLMSDFNKWKIYDEGCISNMMLIMAVSNPSMVDEAFITGFM